MKRIAWLWLLAALAVGCEREAGESFRDASAGPRAGVVIEPDEIRIGDTAWIEIAVVTPPGHAVKPLAAPESVPGFWVLGAEVLPVRREATRWVHATRFHVRARETGEFEWPGQVAVLEDPEGGTSELAIDARPVRVTEVSPEFANRQEPFSFRAPERARRPQGFAIPALLGATATLAGLAILALARRARARSRVAASEEPVRASAPWRAAQAALEAAVADLERDPTASANAASAALRLYVSRRYGAPAQTATTEELTAAEAPLGLGARWVEFVRLLATFDRVRFRPGAAEDPVELGELRAAVRAAQAFVADAATAGAWQ